MGDKIKFERGYYILVFCSGERENGDLHIGKVSNISAIKDPYTLMSRLKVAFIQKELVNLSFLQTDEPNYFPELIFFYYFFFHSKWLKSCQIRT